MKTYRRAFIVDGDILVDLRDLLAPTNLHKCPDPPVQRICWQIVSGHPQLAVDPGVFADQPLIVFERLDQASEPAQGQVHSG